MARKTVNVRAPLAGLDRNWAYQDQAPFSLSDALNARCRDVFEQRQRLGGRGGHAKAFAQQLGNAIPTESFTEDFWPTKDTHLYLNNPDTAMDAGNNNPTLRFGFWTSTACDRIVIHFDLSSIPANATVTNAYLTLKRILRSGVNVASAHKVRRLATADQGWSETQATWNNRATATPWSVANAKNPQTGPYDDTDEVDFSAPVVEGFFTVSGLDALIQDALDNHSEQLHIVIMADDEVTLGPNISIRSSESAVSADWPKLTVTYEV